MSSTGEIVVGSVEVTEPESVKLLQRNENAYFRKSETSEMTCL